MGEGGAEGHRGCRADLGVDLVAYVDVDAHALGHPDDFGRLGETGPGRLYRQEVGAPGEDFPCGLTEVGGRFVCGDRDGGILHKAAAAQDFAGVVGLFKELQDQFRRAAQDLGRLVG
ncbi:hypothetical protein D9M70_607080 [compost metagenome]